MHVSLTPKLEDLVRQKVESGMYNNASEVIREALRIMSEHDEVYHLKLDRLRHAKEFDFDTFMSEVEVEAGKERDDS